MVDSAGRSDSGVTDLRADVIRTRTQYGAVLLDERSGEYWSLNPSADLALSVLVAGGAVPDAVTAVVGSYQVDPAMATADVERLLVDLRVAGLLR